MILLYYRSSHLKTTMWLYHTKWSKGLDDLKVHDGSCLSSHWLWWLSSFFQQIPFLLFSRCTNTFLPSRKIAYLLLSFYFFTILKDVCQTVLFSNLWGSLCASFCQNISLSEGFCSLRYPHLSSTWHTMPPMKCLLEWMNLTSVIQGISVLFPRNVHI